MKKNNGVFLRSVNLMERATCTCGTKSLLGLFFLAACGGSGGNNNNSEKSGFPGGKIGDAGFFAPIYASANGAQNSFSSANLSTVTQRVQSALDKDEVAAAVVARFAAKSGQVILDDQTIIKLTSVGVNPCPSGLTGCSEQNSQNLGIASQALVENLDTLRLSPRNQGSRGTCMAFALSSALEILVRRAGTDVMFSPQNAYFVAKAATGTWNDAGLPPVTAFTQLTTRKSGFVEEKFWPYNPANASCQNYELAHPGFACSASEAQGGGEDGRQQEPQAAAATQYRIVEAHQLYASLGRVKQALYRGYPVVISVNANTDFNLAGRRKGVISWVGKQTNCGEEICGHAVLAVGYQDDASIKGGGYLILKNSWGTSWGVDGLGFASYEWVQNSLLDAQAVVRFEQ